MIVGRHYGQTMEDSKKRRVTLQLHGQSQTPELDTLFRRYWNRTSAILWGLDRFGHGSMPVSRRDGLELRYEFPQEPVNNPIVRQSPRVYQSVDI